MKRIIDKQEHLYIMPSSLQPKIVWRREGGQKIRMRNAQHQPRLLEVVNSNRLEIHKVGGGHHGHGGGLRISHIGTHTVVNPTTDSDLKFVKKFTRPNFRAKEFYTLKMRKSRLFSPAINSKNSSLSVIWPSFG